VFVLGAIIVSIFHSRKKKTPKKEKNIKYTKEKNNPKIK
jgi:ACT domain-containing protein